MTKLGGVIVEQGTQVYFKDFQPYIAIQIHAYLDTIPKPNVTANHNFSGWKKKNKEEK